MPYCPATLLDGSVVAYDREVPGSIPGSAVEFFSSRELFRGMCGVSESLCPFSVLYCNGL